MDFNSNSRFARYYRSQEHFLNALRKSQNGRMFSPQGKEATEIFEMMLVSSSVVLSTAMTASRLGFVVAGPKGATIGALIGASIGLLGAVLVMRWYVEVKQNKNGSLMATYSPIGQNQDLTIH